MKIIYLLSESVSLTATIKGLVDDISTSIPRTYETLATAAEKFAYNNGKMRGFGLVSSGIGGRWHAAFYFNKMQKDLYDLVRHYPTKTKSLQAFLAEGKKTFAEMSQVLPELLLELAMSIKSPQLERAARIWIKSRSNYQSVLQSLKDELDDEEEDISGTSPATPSSIGVQNQQVEDVINHVLSNIPKKIAGEVRNIVAKSANKLQTLRQELLKRGINV